MQWIAICEISYEATAPCVHIERKTCKKTDIIKKREMLDLSNSFSKRFIDGDV